MFFPRKLWGKKNSTERGLKDQPKTITELGGNSDKMEIKFEINKELEPIN